MRLKNGTFFNNITEKIKQGLKNWVELSTTTGAEEHSQGVDWY
jgi:hypothetical protein